ncbi:aldehyde dehydrogenase family protein [Streptomyces sp. NPDC006879]|uniref:aldehyde dehydrogenase family protein n=1 Tax=Streptomyces sp. NPDC006879 TaxID=3364767 RepID=UPI0036833C71
MSQAISEVRDGQAYAIPFAERLGSLDRVANLLRDEPGEVLRIMAEISNHKTAHEELEACIAALEGARDEVMRFQPPRIRQVGVLMPSNIPLYGYVVNLLIPALYSERVVFRPSGRIRSQTRRLHDLLGAVHGLPLEYCAIGQREFLEGVAAGSEVLVFTGSFDNAEKIRRQIDKKQLFLYFGQGINPFVVGPEADVEEAVEGALRVRLLNSGQDCFGPDVFLVHSSISERFCELLGQRVRDLRHGNHEDPRADYGSMYYLDAFEAALDHLVESRRDIVVGGRASLAEGHLQPTVLLRPPQSKVRPAELFAPIFNVVPYTDPAWLRSTLDHQYFRERAMAATVYGDDPQLVELLRSRHLVSVNETLADVENGNEPFGGTGVRANYAAIAGERHTEPLLISKAIADHLAPDTAASPGQNPPRSGTTAGFAAGAFGPVPTVRPEQVLVASR